MENVMYKQDYYEEKYERNVRNIMIYFGFDFSLLGSVYLYELLNEMINRSISICNSIVPSMVNLADRLNVKTKTLNRNIRWSIDKAYKNGLLKNMTCFNKQNVPQTKKILIYLFHFIVNSHS